MSFKTKLIGASVLVLIAAIVVPSLVAVHPSTTNVNDTIEFDAEGQCSQVANSNLQVCLESTTVATSNTDARFSVTDLETGESSTRLYSEGETRQLEYQEWQTLNLTYTAFMDPYYTVQVQGSDTEGLFENNPEVFSIVALVMFINALVLIIIKQ